MLGIGCDLTESDSGYNDRYNLDLRDTGPAGGFIFYINPDADADGWKYLEAAPGDAPGYLEWLSTATWLTGESIATEEAIGTGRANTDINDHGKRDVTLSVEQLILSRVIVILHTAILEYFCVRTLSIIQTL